MNMNKLMKKVICSFLVLITLFSTFVVNVKASNDLPDKLTIVSTNEVKKIFYGDDRIAAYMKKTSNGKYVYCIEADKGSYNNNDVILFDKEITDPGILYLAQNTFPNKSLGFGDEVDYYISQIAVWCYYYVVNGIYSDKVVGHIIDKNGNKSLSFNGSSDASLEQTIIANKAYEIYAAAKKAHDNNKTVTPAINATVGSDKLKVSGSSLLSDAVSVSLTGASKYTVSVTKGTATIVDENGNTKSTFNASEKFKVKVNSLESTEVSVEVKADGTVNKVYSYKPEITSKQKVLYNVVVPTIVPLSKALSFKYSNDNKVEFSKVDATTGKELPGATLIIKDSKSNEVDKWVSTTETHKVKLNPGKYTLTEIQQPDGYILNKETITFTVNADGTCDKVVMENTPIKTIEFSKVDATTKKELPGATLVIKDSKGNEVDRWVSTTKTHKVKLNPGKYTLTEIQQPNGYILNKETIEFTVKEDGTCDKVVMENKPLPGVEFSKVDATTKEELPGATLVIKDSKGNEVDRWVSTTETHKVKLNPGKYTLTEIKQPKGYKLSEETIKFTVKEDGTCDKVVMENELIIADVEISKIDVTTGKELKGAGLEIRDSEGNLIDSWTSSTETHKVKLKPGKYTLTEIIVPDGYKYDSNTITFTVKEDGTCDKVVMENELITADVEISKVDATTGKELKGASLELRDVEGNLIDSWVSTDEVHTIKLVPGKYTLSETFAPDGYKLSTETVTFTVNADGTCDKVVMYNTPYTEVPLTDLNASTFIYALGGILISLGGVVIFRYGKKEEC